MFIPFTLTPYTQLAYRKSNLQIVIDFSLFIFQTMGLGKVLPKTYGEYVTLLPGRYNPHVRF